MKIKKISCFFATAFFIFATFLVPIQAKSIIGETEPGDVAIVPEKDLSIVPEDGLGSIDITLTDTEDNLPKDNVVFGLAKVAEIKNGLYVMNEPFDTVDVDINDIKTANDLEQASRLYKDLVDEPDEIKITDFNGICSFDELQVGVYLIYAIDISQYEVIDPFIVSIPTWDEADEVMTYDVNVLPKHSHLPVIEVNKVDAQTGNNIVSKEFEFTSYSDETCNNKIQTVAGNPQDGIADFVVTYGTTYIKETSAPQGYGLSDEVVKVEFTEDGLFVNDKEIMPENEYIYSIVYKDSLLPIIQTGVFKDNTLFIVAGMGLIVSLIGLMEYRRRGRKNK